MVQNGDCIQHQTEITTQTSSGTLGVAAADRTAGCNKNTNALIVSNNNSNSQTTAAAGVVGMDHIQGKLAGMQLGGGGGVDPSGSATHSMGPSSSGAAGGGVPDPSNNTGPSPYGPGADLSAPTGADGGANSNDYYAFAPGSVGISAVDNSTASAAAGGGGGGALPPQHEPAGIGYLPNGGAGGGGNNSQMYKKSGPQDGAAGGGGGRPGGSAGGAGTDVSRRFGVPMGAGGSRNNASGGGYAPDGGRRTGSANAAGGGRRGQGGAGGAINGGGVSGGRARGGPGVRGYGGGEGSSPLRAAVEPSPLQVPHMGYGGSGGGMSPGSAAMGQGMYAGAGAAAGSMGAMGMQSPPVGVGIHGMGAGSPPVHTAGMGSAMGSHLGHMDPSQQALMGQMQSGMYYGGGGYGVAGAQGAGSPALSHMSPGAGGYPSSPGQGVTYGIQSGQQMGGMEMQQGMATGYPVGAGGMVPNMGVLPGTPNMQSPYGAPWYSGDVNAYAGAMSNGVSNYAGGFAASETGVRDAGSRGANANKAHYPNQVGAQPGHHQPHQQQQPHQPQQQPPQPQPQQPQQRSPVDQYVSAAARQLQGYDAAPDYGRQTAYPIPNVGAAGAYGAMLGYGTYGMVASPKLDTSSRERRRGRGRSGSVTSSTPGFGGPDPQRESELSVATENLTLEEIDGNVFRMSKDQIGCRLLQLKLDQGDPVFVNKICGEAQPYLAEMMKDPFGNYLFQKIADKVDEAGRTELVNKVAGEMVEAGMNLHGTRSVQKVIEVCRNTPSQVALVVAALRDATVTLCLDTNGNHVVQRLLQHLAPSANGFVFEMLAEACVPVATHRHGCCVLQRAMDAATKEQSRMLVAQVCINALQLMQDPYGNYVVQYVLGTCGREEADTLVTVPLGKVAMLSMQKFSSNVIEKCMDRASEEVIVKYVHELADPAAMRPLLQDQYANYVIQKTLQLAPRDAALTLVESIREHLPLMRNSSGGRRMLTKIAKRFPEINLDDDLAVPGAAVMEQPKIEA